MRSGPADYLGAPAHSSGYGTWRSHHHTDTSPACAATTSRQHIARCTTLPGLTAGPIHRHSNSRHCSCMHYMLALLWPRPINCQLDLNHFNSTMGPTHHSLGQRLRGKTMPQGPHHVACKPAPEAMAACSSKSGITCINQIDNSSILAALCTPGDQ